VLNERGQEAEDGLETFVAERTLVLHHDINTLGDFESIPHAIFATTLQSSLGLCIRRHVGPITCAAIF